MSKNNAIFFIVDTYNEGKYDYHGFYVQSNISKENFKKLVKNLYDVNDFDEEVLKAQLDHYTDTEYTIEKINNDNWNEIYQNKFASKAYEISSGKAFNNNYISRMISIEGKSKGISYIQDEKTDYSKFKICFKNKKNNDCYNKSTNIKIKENDANDKLNDIFKTITKNFNDITPKEVENIINYKKNPIKELEL